VEVLPERIVASLWGGVNGIMVASRFIAMFGAVGITTALAQIAAAVSIRLTVVANADLLGEQPVKLRLMSRIK
jgi:hypothetical protein